MGFSMGLPPMGYAKIRAYARFIKPERGYKQRSLAFYCLFRCYKKEGDGKRSPL